MSQIYKVHVKEIKQYRMQLIIDFNLIFELKYVQVLIKWNRKLYRSILLKL